MRIGAGFMYFCWALSEALEALADEVRVRGLRGDVDVFEVARWSRCRGGGCACEVFQEVVDTVLGKKSRYIFSI